MPLPKNLRIDLPGSGELKLTYPDDEEVKNWTWTLYNLHGNKLVFPESGKEPKGYRGLLWRRAGDDRLELISPQEPAYSELIFKSTATFAKPKQPDRDENNSVTINFSAVWGGVAKASYPYPADWGIPWGSDDLGNRALALMYDLVNQMPEELRRTAGPMPIVRIQSIPGAGGFDAPYLSDCILITHDYLDLVAPGSAALTPGDLKFISVVLHEIGHCVTYQKSSLNLHTSLSPVIHALRSIPVGVAQVEGYGLPTLIAAVHALLFDDFVSDYSRAAKWQLSNWLLRAVHAFGPLQIANLLALLTHRSPENPLDPVRPNAITGWKILGALFGLVNEDIAPGLLNRLQDTELSAWQTYFAASRQYDSDVARGLSGAELDASLKARDSSKASWQAARNELENALASSGAVSRYAATDVLEDIAETIKAVTFSAEQLKTIRDPANLARGYWPDEVIVTNAATGAPAAGFAARKQFFIDQGLFPQNWKQLTVGLFLRGIETEDHLDKWRVTL